jgi:hypothetical protein
MPTPATISITPGTGQLLDAVQLVVGANTVVRETMVIADPSSPTQLAGVTVGGALMVDASATTQPISGSVSIAGTVAVTQSTSPWVTADTHITKNLNQDGSGNVGVNIENTPAITVSGTVGVTQSTSPWVVSNGGTFAVQVTAALPTGTNSIGQVTANAGTNLNTSALALDVHLTNPQVIGGGQIAPSTVLMVGGKTNNQATGSFAHVQGGKAVASSVTTVTLTLPANPTPGDLICVGATFSGTISSLSVQDSNSNSYTVTPNSPSPSNAAGNTWLAYLLIAPSNATKTIILSWTNSFSVEVWAEEFSISSGTQVFDKDVTGTGTGTAINTPSITPTFSGELLFSAMACQGTASAPVAYPSTQGLWTGTVGGIQSGNDAEFILSASAATAVNYVQAPSDLWSGMVMGFYISSPGPTYTILPLGQQGRSVIVEGVTSGNPVTVQTTGDVEIVGNAGAILDAAITAATAPTNGLATLVVNETTAPSLTTGQSVAVQCDYVGSQFVKPYRRSQTKAATGSIASTTAATLLAAQAAGIFADLAVLVLTLGGESTAAYITVNISDGTNTYKFAFSSEAIGTAGAGSWPMTINFDPPIPATTAATAWTIALSAADATVYYVANFVLQKAS